MAGADPAAATASKSSVASNRFAAPAERTTLGSPPASKEQTSETAESQFLLWYLFGKVSYSKQQESNDPSCLVSRLYAAVQGVEDVFHTWGH